MTVLAMRTPSTTEQIKMSEKRSKQKAVIINGEMEKKIEKGTKEFAVFTKVDLITGFLFFLVIFAFELCYILHDEVKFMIFTLKEVW